jgi:hypothetical protein
MVHVVGGRPGCDVDRGRISLELPTNDQCVVATCGIDFNVYDGSLHGRILGAHKR